MVLVDNRGIGQSDRPPGPDGVEDMAGDIVPVLDDLGIESCDLAGASPGAMVALQFAASHPGREKGSELWLVIAGCSASCYDNSQTTITQILRSVRVGTAS